jgi:hypothetical protein
MQHSTREKVLLAFVVVSLIFCVFMFLATTKTIVNVSAVGSYGVEVYKDQACTIRVEYIDWGNLTPGSVKNELVYIKNIEEEPMFLRKNTTNWDPVDASKYMTLLWDYSGRRMNHLDVLQITLTLNVSRYIKGISNFSFDIYITASDRSLGDVDGNGKVNVMDMLALKTAITLQETWAQAPFCDVDGNGKVDVADMLALKTIITLAA